MRGAQGNNRYQEHKNNTEQINSISQIYIYFKFLLGHSFANKNITERIALDVTRTAIGGHKRLLKDKCEFWSKNHEASVFSF
jgi:hypothetical protein